MEQGLNVCVSAPTRKVASTYSEILPFCRCNTVHTTYFVPYGNIKGKNAINWSLADVHVLLVDEVTIDITFQLFHTLEKILLQIKLHIHILIDTVFQIYFLFIR